MKEYIEDAKRNLELALEAIEKTPEQNQISELISVCEKLDDHYKGFCLGVDHSYGDAEGSAYKEGVNLEFQIEADWWHDISLALRKLTYNALNKE